MKPHGRRQLSRKEQIATGSPEAGGWWRMLWGYWSADSFPTEHNGTKDFRDMVLICVVLHNTIGQI